MINAAVWDTYISFKFTSQCSDLILGIT